MYWTGMGDLGGRSDPLSRQFGSVDRIVLPPGKVFNRAARQSCLYGQANGLGHTRWVVGETVLEVSGHGHGGAPHNCRRVRGGLVSIDRSMEWTQGGSEAGAGG